MSFMIPINAFNLHVARFLHGYKTSTRLGAMLSQLINVNKLLDGLKVD
jgi:hypothetical protein